MSTFTLENLRESEWGDHPMYATAFSMKRTGFHRWGLCIYRTTYDDDDAWKRYLEVLDGCVRNGLRGIGADVLLPQYMDWTVISDPATLDGASKADVRRHFNTWCAERSEGRDGPGATHPQTQHLPRFRCCLYVDRKCLDTLARLPSDWDPDAREPLPSNLVMAAIDGSFDERTPSSRPGRFPDVEGCTKWYVGWKYIDPEFLITLYEELHGYSLDSRCYFRPPLICPRGRKTMPL